MSGDGVNATDRDVQLGDGERVLCRPAGDLDWVVPDEEQARMAAKDISGFDTVVFGRRTYEMFEAFWRHVVVDESGTVPDPHHPRRRSPEHGAIAIALNKMTKLVFYKNPHGRRVEKFPSPP